MLKANVVALMTTGAMVLASASWAGTAKTYQVTGPLVSASDDTVVVMKGKDKWEIGRDASTKVTGELKPGAKVAIEYRMTATSIDAKEAGAAAKSPASAAKPKAK
jgi:hypothetical protein